MIITFPLSAITSQITSSPVDVSLIITTTSSVFKEFAIVQVQTPPLGAKSGFVAISFSTFADNAVATAFSDTKFVLVAELVSLTVV